jgi:hypothetical protein
MLILYIFMGSVIYDELSRSSFLTIYILHSDIQAEVTRDDNKKNQRVIETI